jgi:hypothetical protein
MPSVEERLAVLESENQYQNEKLIRIGDKIDKLFEKFDKVTLVIDDIKASQKVQTANVSGFRSGFKTGAIVVSATVGAALGAGFDTIVKFIGGIFK